jgi:DNA ligase D-like protein (predicted polymerase)/DNA ligase D-like protein (predicted 3'-phosphoesterase)
MPGTLWKDSPSFGHVHMPAGLYPAETGDDADGTAPPVMRAPELAGASRATTDEGDRFFVQKHAARALHYGLRLELDGVLVSWTVPKGPSLDLGERRLAVKVEDHPLEYGSFEGVIPQGQHGAGTVELWDRGRWTPEGDPRAGLKKGHLRLRLEGERLRGEWDLIRFHGRDGFEKNWLLVKVADAAGVAPSALPGARAHPAPDLPAFQVAARVPDAQALPARQAWIDAEVVFDAQGRTRFQALQQVLAEGPGDLHFQAFDLVHLDGLDLTRVPLRERKEMLKRLIETLGLDDTMSTRADAPSPGAPGRNRVEVERTDRQTPPFLELPKSLRTPAAQPPRRAITHPEKVLYPDLALTKGDLAWHALRVAEPLLAHALGRPLTIVRCPAGLSAPCFFQKHLGKLGPGLRKVDTGDGEPMVCLQSADGLVSLVQMGVMEFHLWGSRAQALEKPDRLVFDLDPDADVKWARVAEAAQQIRARLEALGLQSFPLSTGGKGLHIVLPLSPQLGWDELAGFSRALADEQVRRAPGQYTATLSKAKRNGRIFIDSLRNGRGGTAIAPFSPRARPGATVALPLRWDEVDPAKPQPLFSMADTATLTARMADDPWAGYFQVEQTISAAARRTVMR